MSKENQKNQPDNTSAGKSDQSAIPATEEKKASSDKSIDKAVSVSKAELEKNLNTSDAEDKRSVAVEQPKEEPEKKAPVSTKEAVKLSGLYAFKLAMSSVYDEKGRFTPVTFLEVKPWMVSQVKRKEKEGYNSVQIACMPQKNNRSSKALKNHLSAAGFSEGARYVKEIRQDSVDNIEVGQPVSIHSVQKGDKVKLHSISKGHGFAGVVKRWGFKGGPASHGAKTHRTSGSIGNRTEPARVMPGKKMSGHYGVEKVSLRNVQVVDVIEEKNLIVVKGSVPGARNSLVFLQSR